MIQIPGIKFGIKDVIALATLNSAIEDTIQYLLAAGLESLDDQAEFLSQCLDSWLEATKRKEDITASGRLQADNVVYQGRVISSVLMLVPACILALRRGGHRLLSKAASDHLTEWFRKVLKRAGLLNEDGEFIPKGKFKTRGFLGSGGIARFRDTLWAATGSKSIAEDAEAEEIAEQAKASRDKVFRELSQ
jgi:hypothetical protein